MEHYSTESLEIFKLIVKFEKYKNIANFPHNDKCGKNLMFVILNKDPELFPIIIDLICINPLTIDVLFNTTNEEKYYIIFLKYCNVVNLDYFAGNLLKTHNFLPETAKEYKNILNNYPALSRKICNIIYYSTNKEYLKKIFSDQSTDAKEIQEHGSEQEWKAVVNRMNPKEIKYWMRQTSGKKFQILLNASLRIAIPPKYPIEEAVFITKSNIHPQITVHQYDKDIRLPIQYLTVDRQLDFPSNAS